MVGLFSNMEIELAKSADLWKFANENNFVSKQHKTDNQYFTKHKDLLCKISMVKYSYFTRVKEIAFSLRIHKNVLKISGFLYL